MLGAEHRRCWLGIRYRLQSPIVLTVPLLLADVEVPAAARHADALRVDDVRGTDVVAFAAVERSSRHTEGVAGFLDGLDESLRIVRLEKRVGVAEEHEIAARGADALIHGGAEAAVVAVGNQLRTGSELADDVRASVSGRVIDDDDLDIAPRLSHDTRQTARQIPRAVPGDDDDRET